MRFSRITIIRSRVEPAESSVNELLQWLGGSLGLFNPRDKDKSCYRVFLALLRALKTSPDGVSSDALSVATGLARGTVVHHLNRLMQAGIVIYERGLYSLRMDSLEELVAEVRSQVNKTFDGMTDVAKYLDRNLGL